MGMSSTMLVIPINISRLISSIKRHYIGWVNKIQQYSYRACTEYTLS